MIKYHKIQTVFKRDPANNNKTLLMGEYSLDEFDYLKNNKWVFTEKVDGTNIRIFYSCGGVNNVGAVGAIGVGGKTDNDHIPGPLLSVLAKKEKVTNEVFYSVFGVGSVCLYGEGYGPKIIKGGGNYGKTQDFVLFDVHIDGFWLKREDVEDIGKKLGLDVVPIIGEGSLLDMVKMAQDGFNSQWGDFKAEGIVARPKTELYCRNSERVITKIKLKDFRK